jgi:uncharacterized protein YprB with RNaseH-like and TPR domain
MNELQARIVKLRRQSGNASGPRLNFATDIDLAQGSAALIRRRLRRLKIRRGDDPCAERTSPVELAEILGGSLTTNGLIVVEQFAPLGATHGDQRIDGDAVEGALRFFDYAGDSAVFMDTETTGLAGGSGTLVFLLGLGRLTPGGLQVNQYFLTHFDGESALLEHAQEFVGNAGTLVTYNGKSFDQPLLKTRCCLARMKDPFGSLNHLDLLHVTRRAYANRWPDCSLKTAEKHLLGFVRVRDIPGAEVPQVWFDWIRRGVAADIARVLRHNRWDIVSLAALLPALHRCYADPIGNNANIVSTASHYVPQRGEPEAYDYLRRNRAQLDDASLMQLARLARRRRNWVLAVEIWRDLMAARNIEATECLAKYLEHVARDPAEALICCRKLIQYDEFAEPHRHRERRLLVKLGVS